MRRLPISLRRLTANAIKFTASLRYFALVLSSSNVPTRLKASKRDDIQKFVEADVVALL